MRVKYTPAPAGKNEDPTSGGAENRAHLRRRRKDHDDTPSNETEGLIGRQPLWPIVPPGTEWRPNSLDEVQWSLYLGVALEWAININLRKVRMSNTSQIALIRKLYAAMGDVNSFKSLLADDVEWDIEEGFPNGGVYRGIDGVSDFFTFSADFDEFYAKGDEYFESGDT